MQRKLGIHEKSSQSIPVVFSEHGKTGGLLIVSSVKTCYNAVGFIYMNVKVGVS